MTAMLMPVLGWAVHSRALPPPVARSLLLATHRHSSVLLPQASSFDGLSGTTPLAHALAPGALVSACG